MWAVVCWLPRTTAGKGEHNLERRRRRSPASSCACLQTAAPRRPADVSESGGSLVGVFAPFPVMSSWTMWSPLTPHSGIGVLLGKRGLGCPQAGLRRAARCARAAQGGSVLVAGESAGYERQQADTGRAGDRERGFWELCGFACDPGG